MLSEGVATYLFVQLVGRCQVPQELGRRRSPWSLLVVTYPVVFAETLARVRAGKLCVSSRIDSSRLIVDVFLVL